MCDISSLRVNGPSEPGRLRDVCVCQRVNIIYTWIFSKLFFPSDFWDVMSVQDYLLEERGDWNVKLQLAFFYR